MNKKYNLRILQVTNATRDNTLALARRSIVNNDRLEIYVCTELVCGILKEIVATLKKEFTKDDIAAHVSVKVPFSCRAIKPAVLAAFSLD